MTHEMNKIGVVGLWHLGSVIAGAWASLGKQVVGLDFDAKVVAALEKCVPPIFEPGLPEMISEGLNAGRLTFSCDPTSVADCEIVFIAYDTPVNDDDTCDITPINKAFDAILPVIRPGTLVIVSAQLPVGMSLQLRKRLQDADPTCELVYSPENLRLGQAIACYKVPGHVVIGAETEQATGRALALFEPMKAVCRTMNLASSEMTKHGINSFLAVCVTFANQLADLCEKSGADFAAVRGAMMQDPRIGTRSYLSAGLGFSGGTLGRDLRVLKAVNEGTSGTSALFGDTWIYNLHRPRMVGRRAISLLDGIEGKTIALLGMTYKPNTSTLRRSLPLAVAQDLIARGCNVQVYDPKADWTEVSLPSAPQFRKMDSAYAAAEGAAMVVLLTEWPEFLDLDFVLLKRNMDGAYFFDTKNFLSERFAQMTQAGLVPFGIGCDDLAGVSA